MGIVTCRKCKKIFDYDKYMGICPKCCHYYSTTSYDNDLKYENNILEASDHNRCSYHGSHMSGINSGHNEILHTNKYEIKNSDSIEKEKEEIARKLREKYTNNLPTRSDLNRNTSTISSTTREVSSNIDGKDISTRPRNISVNLKDADIRYNVRKEQNKKSKNMVTIIFLIFFGLQFIGPFIMVIFGILIEILSTFF